MILIYVAGSYSADTEAGVFDNIMRHREASLRLWQKGYAVICPHMNTAFMPLTHTEVMPGDLEILSRCDAIYLTVGWRQSKGAKREWKRALACRLKIYMEGVNEPPEIRHN